MRPARSSRHSAFGAATALLGVTLVLPNNEALATDHLLAGTKLTAKSRSGRASFQWVSKDPAVAFPASPPSTAGATLVVMASDGDTATVPLGSASWSETSGGTRATYKNPDAPAGDSVCKVAVIKAAKMVKVVCKSDVIDTLDPGPENGVSVRLTVGSDNYCATFGGVERDEPGTFTARRAPAPSGCDVVPTTTTTSTTVLFCATTTTISVCNRQTDCRFGICPQSQTCEGTGSCDCVGPPVPCGEVGHPALCQFGECPPGMQCVSAYAPPTCPFGCECR